MDLLLSQVNIPAWNYVFADTFGDIGFRVVGNIFKHQDKPPFGAIQVSWKDFFQPDFLTPVERPHLIKPKTRKYLYTANHRHWPTDALYHGGQAYSLSFRGKRIDHLLKKDQHDLKTFQNIQCDRFATDAEYFVPLLLQFLQKNLKDDNTQKAYHLLSTWNFKADASCLACGLYRRWIDLIHDEWKTLEPATYRILLHLLKNPEEKNNLELTKSLLNNLRMAINDTGFKPWKDLHVNNFKHLSTQMEQTTSKEWQFSPEISTEGDTHSIDPGTSKWNNEKKIFEQYSGASMRMIIEMDKKKPKIFLSLPFKNQHYHQLINNDNLPWQDWANCKYQEVEW